ncbi:MAG TPA: FliA/WhiG family RNA polymerase sigma factor [Candidatus Acidoferrum sp.]|nr:FliA/WhiG family RNA polymerase sigma factor [Candidatus Acidoferrum sp.]
MDKDIHMDNGESTLSAAEREKLVLEHLPEVRYIARRIHERLPVQVPFEDLVHAGIVGLMEALQRFDPKKQVHLKSYAKFRIRGAILDSLRTTDWSPRSLRKQARMVEAAYVALSSELGRAPSETELANRVGMDLLAFQQLLGDLHGLNMGSLQALANEDLPDEETCIYQPNGPDEDPFFQCLRSELRSQLSEAMNTLDEKERQVLGLYYFDELTMKEVGATLGITESRVSQIHSLALIRLRTRIQELLQARTSGASQSDSSQAAPAVESVS